MQALIDCKVIAGIAPVVKPGARVLVAEDNPVNSMVILMQLKRLGYEASLVNTGAEAVEAVEQGSYDLVLMDCHMPVMDGIEATRRIRKSKHRDISIIALTASAMSEDRDRCLSEGMNDYLSKPLDLKRLKDALSRWLPGETPETPLPRAVGTPG
jgi:CheY-like chemotaxis protein